MYRDDIGITTLLNVARGWGVKSIVKTKHNSDNLPDANMISGHVLPAARQKRTSLSLCCLSTSADTKIPA